MSDDAQVQAEISALFSSFVNARYSYSVAAAILAYDYLVTLDLEIAQVWGQRFTAATVLFLLNRYAFPFVICLTMIEIFHPLNDNVCTILGWAENSIDVAIVSTTIIFIFTLRTWAIYLKSWKVLLFVGIFAIAKYAMTISAFASIQSFSATLGFGCIGTPRNIFLKFNKANGYLNLAFDTVVFVLTFVKTFRSALQMRKLGMTNSVTFWILRDGLLYYVGRVLLVIFQIVSFQFPPGAVYQFSALLPNVIANVLINHLLLNLRHVSTTHPGGGLSQKTIPELNFATNSIIGNIGAPLTNDPVDFSAESTQSEIVETESETSGGFDGSSDV
ncbi:hypothetical protein BD410DRAFT_794313 [Rickenella mellea]|uniref:DUF6533 domain-containing protein n=1 Tax=Rickenella mellea TaxID=50990 RepID=A0A4Y7PRK3_9AGAM|nr:hypothetical protein BD410DRAFT_794313 [Rickenella mellea]